MHTSEAEKDWLRRICGGQPVTEQQTAPAKEAEHKPVAEKKANGHGFGDIAGMNELKEFVTEGFINVEPQVCRGIWHQASLHALLWSCRLRQDVLCREDGRGDRHQLHEDRA